MSTHHETEREPGWTSPPAAAEQDFSAQTLPQSPHRPPRPKANRWVVRRCGDPDCGAYLEPGCHLPPRADPAASRPGEADPDGARSQRYSNAGYRSHPNARAGRDPRAASVSCWHRQSGALECYHWHEQCGKLCRECELRQHPGRSLAPGAGEGTAYTPPVRLFELQTNSAKISSQSTIITDDVDNKKTDVYREYAWSGNGFTQVVFSGMYPALTRWQADDAQAAVVKGQNVWMLDAVKTVQHMFVFAGPDIKLIRGGGTRDLDAVVQVTIPSPEQPNAPRRVTQVTLSRLDRNPNGICEVTAVGSDWLSISTPTRETTIRSPVTVTGFGPQFDAKIGEVFILDHLNQPIQEGDTSAMAPDGSSPLSEFSLKVTYTSSFQGGAQEGIVELFHIGGTPSDYGLVMVKVLIAP